MKNQKKPEKGSPGPGCPHLNERGAMEKQKKAEKSRKVLFLRLIGFFLGCRFSSWCFAAGKEPRARTPAFERVRGHEKSEKIRKLAYIRGSRKTCLFDRLPFSASV